MKRLILAAVVMFAVGCGGGGTVTNQPTPAEEYSTMFYILEREVEIYNEIAAGDNVDRGELSQHKQIIDKIKIETKKASERFLNSIDQD